MTIYYSNNITKTLLQKNTQINSQILALDIGTKRIGVAISDEKQIFSLPKEIITRQSNKKDFAKIAQIINNYNISIIVIGLPLNIDKTQSAMSQFVEKFSQNLNQFLSNNIIIILHDERLTTHSAKQYNNKQQYCDDIAASLILEDFIMNFKKI
ncbi:MAG: Holliday junction resolvase RuvX [Rickettsiales bacterium]|nr:Holliday junction resolvase RuvX [Rickettsiales bacterium]|tara:strand:+ start:13875 stop:14336 length:462 start_codon:yes stop_codon:yes gene_type:complete